MIYNLVSDYNILLTKAIAKVKHAQVTPQSPQKIRKGLPRLQSVQQHPWSHQQVSTHGLQKMFQRIG